MSQTLNSIVKLALDLPLKQRARVVDELLNSLDTPDSKIDAVWASEADARVAALDNWEVSTISSEDVFSKYLKK